MEMPLYNCQGFRGFPGDKGDVGVKGDKVSLDHVDDFCLWTSLFIKQINYFICSFLFFMMMMMMIIIIIIINIIIIKQSNCWKTITEKVQVWDSVWTKKQRDRQHTALFVFIFIQNWQLVHHLYSINRPTIICDLL